MTEIEAPPAGVQGPRVWPVSVKAYEALSDMGLIPEKTELLYGQIFCKMPKSPIHTLLLLRLLELLQRALPPGLHVRPEQPVVCGDSEPEPDLSVLRGSMDDYRTGHPHTAEFIIEVCVSSHEYDRLKLRAYASAGVKEVWLVLSPENQIEVYRNPTGDEFTERFIQGPHGELSSGALPGLTVNLDVLFRS
jgi:Uma2 family endonuclease